MSKSICITPKLKEELRREFEHSLENAKLTDGKISFTKSFPSDQRKAEVLFTAEAWAKMVMLIQEFSKEIAWHGVAHRVDTEDGAPDMYLIEDILVYPQEVTGATVSMDTAKYAQWIQENDEDERFYNIHMQGHSHVNMAPNPSSVDLQHQETILSQLGTDNFYIFMIWNKSFKRNIKVYDMEKNALFEDGDIQVRICGGVDNLDEFIHDAKAKVKEYTYTYKTPTYQGGVNKSYDPVAGSAASSSAKDDKPRTQIGAGWKGNNTCNTQKSLYPPKALDEDEDSPYGAFGYKGDSHGLV